MVGQLQNIIFVTAVVHNIHNTIMLMMLNSYEHWALNKV